MTQRLYYDQTYLKEFDAVVTSCSPSDNGNFVIHLDKSAFYPTSGGQPFDMGTIDSANVIDVTVDKDGDISHFTDKAITVGTAVHCVIDWERRFDHMQQHAGEHILAGCVYRLYNGHTIGLHLGHEDSSIDVELPDGRTHLTADEIRTLEDEVNKRIQLDVPIKCWFPDNAELSLLPLRKAPTVSEHIRIVQIGDDEFCACGGTHPSSAGQIGLFKLIDVRPSRGKVRLTFVCGKRAFEYLRTCYDALTEVNRLTSSVAGNVSKNVASLIERLKDTEFRLQQIKNQAALKELRVAVSNALIVNGIRIVNFIFDGMDGDALREAATSVISESNSIAILGSRQPDSSIVILFARSAELTPNMGTLMKACGARGGGKPDFARGSCTDESVFEKALTILKGELA